MTTTATDVRALEEQNVLQTYRRFPVVFTRGEGVRLFDDGTIVTAYVWLDPGAAPFSLEPCDDGPQRGIRARRAGGGAYAWRALEPDHGLVSTICPPPAWLPEDRPSNRPPPVTGLDRDDDHSSS